METTVVYQPQQPQYAPQPQQPQYAQPPTGAPQYTGETATLPADGEIVVRLEKGEGRLISVVERVDDSRSHVLNERVVEHEVRIPKRVVREEIIEKVIVVPEKVVVEEVVEEVQIVKEKIVEVARPTVVQKVIEIPEIEYHERIVQVHEEVVKENVIEVPNLVKEERVVEYPNVVYVDKEIEIPEVRYRRVPAYMDRDAASMANFEEQERKIPVPVEAEVTYEYRLPALKPKYMKATYPVYLPRFIEVPVAAELLTPATAKQAQEYLASVAGLTTAVAGLGQVEDLAAKADQFMRNEIEPRMNNGKLDACVAQAWNKNTIQINQPTNAETTTQTVPVTVEGGSVHQGGSIHQGGSVQGGSVHHHQPTLAEKMQAARAEAEAAAATEQRSVHSRPTSVQVQA